MALLLLLEGEEVGTGPVLPRVKVLELSCFTKTSDLGYIAGCCPDLEVLHLHIAISPFNMTRLASTLRSHCRKLTALISRQRRDFSEINHSVDEGEDSEYGGAISTLIRGCSLSGLVRIKLETGFLDPTDKDGLRSVLVHSTTLEHLTIDFTEEQYQELEPMDIPIFSRSLPATLKLLKSQPWGCLELEAFSLYIPCSLSDESDDEYEFEDDEYVFEDDDDDDDEGRHADQGTWYCHDFNPSTVSPLVWSNAFEMVQGLDRLLLLSLNSITYTRSSDPQIMEIFDDYYDL
ncbi:hypothetical protein BGX24_001166 [Mortierella sp. AD032]|nr:hypothetical protein BGX24_001166 [Mortierella sp. AD032]